MATPALQIVWHEAAAAALEALARQSRDLALEIGQLYEVIRALDRSRWTQLPRVRERRASEDLRWYRPGSVVVVMYRADDVVQVLEAASGARPLDFERAIERACARLRQL